MNCEDSETLNEDLYLVRKVDQELIREGFRMVYTKYHREDLHHLFRSYKVFLKLSADKNWILKGIMGILSGEMNPKVFLSSLKDKLKEHEQSGNYSVGEDL